MTGSGTLDAAALRDELVRQLVGNGSVASSWVRDAFTVVPRELFVPRFQLGDRWYDSAIPDGRDAWLRGAYTDDALITQQRPAARVVDPDGLPTSSSTSPSVMAGMLEELDLQPGHRVLEIGTGTGYNTALLCRRVGAGNVVSVELDADLAAAARAALAALDLFPLVLAGDGAAGASGHGPFDRILCTASADHVPPAWIDQLVPGGVVVVDLRGSLTGRLVRLVHDGMDSVHGRFLSRPGAFMPLRAEASGAQRAGEDWDVVYDRTNPQRRSTPLHPADLSAGRFDPGHSLRMMIQLHLAGHRLRGFAGPAADGTCSGISTDGSWFEVREDGTCTVAQGGPLMLWDTVEAAHSHWRHLDRPQLSRFGVSAATHPALQRIWLDDPVSGPCWPLPL